MSIPCEDCEDRFTREVASTGRLRRGWGALAMARDFLRPGKLRAQPVLRPCLNCDDFAAGSGAAISLRRWLEVAEQTDQDDDGERDA
jgi:hypothetical protein